MKIRYFAETDTLHIEFRNVPVTETRDLDENTLLDIDAEGNISAITTWRLRGLPAGTYDWSVRAVDSAFNGGTRASGTFMVTLPSEPQVAIVRPRAGSTVKGAVTIRVSARDDQDPPGQLNIVVVVVGQMLLPATYDSVTQLFNAVWDTTAVADGPYVLRAFAVDTLGNRGASRRVWVIVNNVP